jgi:hypothetical protein
MRYGFVMPGGCDARDAVALAVAAEQAVDWIGRYRTEHGIPGEYQVVTENTTPADDPAAAAATVRPWRDAGATWYLEANWSVSPEQARAASIRRLEAGPPRAE